MTRLLTLLLFLGCSTFLTAQICNPDPIYQDSSAGVYPLPFHPESNPDGGITESACINKPYEFVLTVKIDSTLNVNGTDYAIDSLIVTDVINMPNGFSYECSTANCTFVKNSFECATLFGTATADNAPGDYSIEIQGTVFTNFNGFPFELELSFPNPIFADGEYVITLNEEGGECSSTNVNDLSQQVLNLQNIPNPFDGLTNIQITSQLKGDFQFRVHDVFGKQVHERAVQLNEGQNTLEFDGSGLATGLYIYSFSNGKAVVSNKMMITK